MMRLPEIRVIEIDEPISDENIYVECVLAMLMQQSSLRSP